jgi:hypothetical protein
MIIDAIINNEENVLIKKAVFIELSKGFSFKFIEN